MAFCWPKAQLYVLLTSQQQKPDENVTLANNMSSSSGHHVVNTRTAKAVHHNVTHAVCESEHLTIG